MNFNYNLNLHQYDVILDFRKTFHIKIIFHFIFNQNLSIYLWLTIIIHLLSNFLKVPQQIDTKSVWSMNIYWLYWQPKHNLQINLCSALIEGKGSFQILFCRLAPCPCPYVGQGPCSAACFPRAATYQASSLQIFSVFFVTLFIKSLRKWRMISFLCSSSPSRCPPPPQTRRCWRSGKV